MAKAAPVTDINTLKAYIEGVMARADHHAPTVGAVALALAGAIVWKKDDDPIEVMTRDGDMKNVLWVKINGNRYAFSFNHNAQRIELREDSTQGPVLHVFSNSTPVVDVQNIFEGL